MVALSFSKREILEPLVPQMIKEVSGYEPGEILIFCSLEEIPGNKEVVRGRSDGRVEEGWFSEK